MDGSAMERWTACDGLLVMDGLAMEHWTACDELLGDGAMDGSRWTAWRWSTRTAWRWSTRWLLMDGVAMDCACNGLAIKVYTIHSRVSDAPLPTLTLPGPLPTFCSYSWPHQKITALSKEQILFLASSNQEQRVHLASSTVTPPKEQDPFMYFSYEVRQMTYPRGN